MRRTEWERGEGPLRGGDNIISDSKHAVLSHRDSPRERYQAER